MPNTAPPYTIGGITRPALIFDNAGNIILTPEAAAFQAAYGTKALYAGLPANTPYPPVAATLSAPLDNNGGINSVLENAAVGTQTGITVQANNNGGPPVTYSLTDNAGGRFQINATTGVVTVAAALDFETAPSQAYNITVQANDGIFSTSQTFTIGVGNVNEAPAGTNNTITASEDTNRVFTSADFGFTDPSDSVLPNTLAAVRITTLPAAGTLLNNGVAVAAGDSISAADIAAGHLVFVPAANANGAGYASFTFQVRDNGGTANGGVDTDQSPNTMTINVTAVNDAPTATNLTQSLVINEDAAATQLFSVAPAVADIDSGTVTATLTLDVAAGVLVGAGAGVLNGTVLTYTITGSPAAVNTALAAVTYDSAANFHGTASVGIAVTDGANGPQGTNPTGTISITVNSVNDAPAGTNNTITASEDTNRVFTAADFGFSDTSDSPANALDAVRITTLPAAGTLLNNGNPVSAGGFVSVADINGGHLVFVPAANASGTGYASFTFQVRDDGGTASGGTDTDASANTITIDVTAVNDAPTATGLTQPLTISEDAAATTLFTVAPAVGDIDSASVTATLTLDAAAGVLVGAGAGVLNAGVLTYTITGAAAAVNTALASVTFDSANDFNGSTGVGITIDDGGNGPQGTNPTGTVSINVTAVNDAPIATNLTQSLTISEDAAATTLFTLPPVASDIDSATVTATLTLDPAAGVLNGAGSSVLVGGLLTYTITGTPAAVNAALAAVTYDSPPDFNGTASVGVTIDDGANGPQGTNPTGTISITVDAVNDAPVATNLTQSLVINEDDGATTLFTLAPLVTDVDSGTVTATLTLDAAAGFLVGAGPGALNAGVLTYTITGSPLTVSNALALVAFDSADDFNGITDVGITISDGANGPQGSNPIGTGTVTINAVNDAPTATNLTQSLSVGEDGAAATLFTLAPVVADVDSSNVTATLTLDPAAGVLTGAGTGVLALGVLTYTITGTPAAVNAALAAVTYDSAPDFFGSSNVGVTIDDGGAGPQGTNPTGTVSITVTAVNDAPTATNLSQSLTIDEDAAATTLFALPPVTADIDSANVTARLTLDAAAGVLNGAGAGVLALGVLTYTITGTPAAVNAALAAVTYDSAPDFFGSPNVGVAIDDGANGPQGTNPTGTIGITVNPVNDAPTLAATAVNPAYVPGADLFSGVTASTVESGQTIVQLVLTVTNISDTESLLIDGATVALVDGTVSG
ncbi:MAG: hypothetical protein JWR80_3461, partial [Bradyrhizobium sp.]|nr:hypothetical protein [Bradyrhizobium sp.]